MLNIMLSLDEQGLLLINQKLATPWFDWFFPAITDLHDSLIFKYLFLPGLFLFLIFKLQKKGALIFTMALLSLALSDAIGSQLFKKTFQRPRPHTRVELNVIKRSPSSGFSFISNHSVNMFNAATYFSSFFPPATPVLYTLASLVAISRIYNGAHYPSDVLLGAILGYLIGFLMSRFTQKIILKFKL